MKLKIHYLDNTEGEPTAVKMDIGEWNRLKNFLSEASEKNSEAIDFVETPVKVEKMQVKQKKRSFSDFLMDI